VVLALGPLRCERAQLLELSGETVAGALERAEVGQARPSGGAHLEMTGRGHVRERVGEDRRVLALEPGNLCPQRATSGAFSLEGDTVG
jgi:hypothetical protein